MFYTNTGLIVAIGYNRVVHGERGSYIEFEPEHMVAANLHIPKNQIWRQHHQHAYYLEYRTNDSAHVKVYYQKRTVTYADYIIGKCYISPNDLSQQL